MHFTSDCLEKTIHIEGASITLITCAIPTKLIGNNLQRVRLVSLVAYNWPVPTKLDLSEAMVFAGVFKSCHVELKQVQGE